MTLRSYEYRIDAFVDWCQENGNETMAEVTGMELHKYRFHRPESDGIKPVTLGGKISSPLPW